MIRSIHFNRAARLVVGGVIYATAAAALLTRLG